MTMRNAFAALATEDTLALVRAGITHLASAARGNDTLHAVGDAGVPLLAVRRDGDDVPGEPDGYAVLRVNDEGRLKVSTKPALYGDVVGEISATQAIINAPVEGATVVADVRRASNVMLFCTGVFAGIHCAFEGSLEDTGDANWFAIQAVRSNANTIETSTGALSAQPAYAWEASVNALARVRVRCTARTSGVQTWRIKLGSYATEPIPANQVTSVTASMRNSGSWYAETTTNLAAGASFTGSSRACGTTSAMYNPRFRVRVFSSQPGALTIKSSRDSTAANFRALPEHTNIPVVAGEVLMIDAAVIGYYCRVEFTNTGAAATTALEILSALLL